MKEYDIIVDIQNAGLNHHEFKKLLMVFSPFIERAISNELLIACRDKEVSITNPISGLQMGANLFNSVKMKSLSDSTDKTKILNKSKGVEI